MSNYLFFPLMATGGVGNYLFQVVAGSGTTIPAEVVTNPVDIPAALLTPSYQGTPFLRVDTGGKDPGSYAVTVRVTSGLATPYDATIPVTVLPKDTFRIQDKGFQINVDTLPTIHEHVLTTSCGDNVSWRIVNSDTPLVGVDGVSGKLTIPIERYGDYQIEVEAVDSVMGRVSKVLPITILPTRPYKLQDGRVEVALYGRQQIRSGNHTVRITATDAEGAVVDQICNVQTVTPSPSFTIPTPALEKVLTPSSTGAFPLPLETENKAYQIGSAALGTLLGMRVTVVGGDAPQNQIQGPPTTFGAARLLLKDPILSGGTPVGYVCRDFSVAAIRGSASNWGVGHRHNIPTVLVGEFITINPLQPWPNAADWVKGAAWTVRVAASSLLPPGVSLDKVSGLLYGRPTIAGNYTTSLEYMEDTGRVVGGVTLTWDCRGSDFQAALRDLPSSLVANQKYIGAITHNSPSPITRCELVGNPLSGVSFTPTSGVEVKVEVQTNMVGVFDLLLRITNNDGQDSYLRIDLNVSFNDPLRITTLSIPTITSEYAYSYQLNATGGAGDPYTWATTTSLPSGITLSPQGLLSGYTTDQTYNSTLALSLTDSEGNTATASLNLQILNQLQITSTTLPFIRPGKAYNFTLNARGGKGSNYQWAVNTLPPGLQLTPTTGTISGLITSTAPYSQNITISVTEPVSGQTATKNYTLTVNAASGDLVITPYVGPVKRGASYNGYLQVTGGGSGTYQWSSTTLPQGLTLSYTPGNSAVAYIVGRTTEIWDETRDCVVVVVDSLGNKGEIILPKADFRSVSSIAASYPITKTASGYASALPVGVVGALYSQQLQATTATPPLSWEGVTLPPGAALSSDGLLTWTPSLLHQEVWNENNTGYSTVKVSDGLGDSLLIPIPLLIQATPPLVTNTTLPVGSLGSPYKQQLNVVGGSTGPYSVILATGSPALPPEFFLENTAQGSFLVSPNGGYTPVDVSLVFAAMDGLGEVGPATPALRLQISSAISHKTGYDEVTSQDTKFLGFYPRKSSHPLVLLDELRTFQFALNNLIHKPTDTSDLTAWVRSFSVTSNFSGISAHPLYDPALGFDKVRFQVECDNTTDTRLINTIPTDPKAAIDGVTVVFTVTGPNIVGAYNATCVIKRSRNIRLTLTAMDGTPVT